MQCITVHCVFATLTPPGDINVVDQCIFLSFVLLSTVHVIYTFKILIVPQSVTTEAGEGDVGSALKQVVKVVAGVAGLTLFLPALFFTQESRGPFV